MTDMPARDNLRAQAKRQFEQRMVAMKAAQEQVPSAPADPLEVQDPSNVAQVPPPQARVPHSQIPLHSTT